MEVIPGLHAIDLGIVYVYLYQEADKVSIFDSGMETHAERILGEVAALGRRPEDIRQIVVSHHHPDHAGSLAELAERSGASVLAHELDAPVVRGEVEGPPPVLPDAEKEVFEGIAADVPPLRPTHVDRELADGDEIELDGGAQVVHVPGHTAGSIALYLPKRRLLLCGDAAVCDPEGRLIVGMFNVDTEQARQSFRRLAELDFEVACFGHGAPLDKEASFAFRRLAEKLG